MHRESDNSCDDVSNVIDRNIPAKLPRKLVPRTGYCNTTPAYKRNNPIQESNIKLIKLGLRVYSKFTILLLKRFQKYYFPILKLGQYSLNYSTRIYKITY